MQAHQFTLTGQTQDVSTKIVRISLLYLERERMFSSMTSHATSTVIRKSYLEEDRAVQTCILRACFLLSVSTRAEEVESKTEKVKVVVDTSRLHQKGPNKAQ